MGLREKISKVESFRNGIKFLTKNNICKFKAESFLFQITFCKFYVAVENIEIFCVKLLLYATWHRDV